MRQNSLLKNFVTAVGFVAALIAITQFVGGCNSEKPKGDTTIVGPNAGRDATIGEGAIVAGPGASVNIGAVDPKQTTQNDDQDPPTNGKDSSPSPPSAFSPIWEDNRFRIELIQTWIHGSRVTCKFSAQPKVEFGEFELLGGTVASKAYFTDNPTAASVEYTINGNRTRNRNAVRDVRFAFSLAFDGCPADAETIATLHVSIERLPGIEFVKVPIPYGVELADSEQKRELLISYLKSPEVTTLLAPFCSPGTKKAYSNSPVDGANPRPMSLRSLASIRFGYTRPTPLENNSEALRRLVKIANHPANDRGSWPVTEDNVLDAENTHQDMHGNMVHPYWHAQELLRVHGSLLVEIGMLVN